MDTEEFFKKPTVEDRVEVEKPAPTIKDMLDQQRKINDRVAADRKEQILKQLTEKPTKRKKITVK